MSFLTNVSEQINQAMTHVMPYLESGASGAVSGALSLMPENTASILQVGRLLTTMNDELHNLTRAAAHAPRVLIHQTLGTQMSTENQDELRANSNAISISLATVCKALQQNPGFISQPQGKRLICKWLFSVIEMAQSTGHKIINRAPVVGEGCETALIFRDITSARAKSVANAVFQLCLTYATIRKTFSHLNKPDAWFALAFTCVCANVLHHVRRMNDPQSKALDSLKLARNVLLVLTHGLTGTAESALGAVFSGAVGAGCMTILERYLTIHRPF